VLLCEFPIALGKNPLEPKTCQGDGRTPEGCYYVCTRNEKSKFHLALGLSYPNGADGAGGRKSGLITQEEYGAILAAQRERRRPPWDTALGGEIMIHGGGTDGDWTAGCIALSNEDMELLWEKADMGTEVIISK